MSSAAQRVAVAIGTFDGVHLGHRRVVQEALATGLPVRVLTFHPHPRVVLGNLVELISSVERRLELFAELGVAETTVLDFTLDVAQQEPEDFAAVHLAGAGVVVAGEGFRFGRRRRGDLELLERLGFTVRPVPHLEGVSSTEIRRRLHTGEVKEAARLLGRPPELEGIVVSGDQRGGTLGYPTANLAVDPGLLVEAYLLDFEGDLYGQELRLEFLARLRGERRFESVDALVEQMHRDVGETRRTVTV